MKAYWKKYTLQFKNPSGTSRGILRTKDSYFLFLENEGKKGIGECGILRGLSADDRPDYEDKLDELIHHINRPFAELYADLMEFPSIQFGLEMAWKDLDATNHELFPSSFTRGEETQAINGLIWMGDQSFMKEQLRKRLEEGFHLIKMKVGAIDFASELEILKSIRKEFGPETMEIRVDANGAFQAHEAPGVLEQLASLNIHSIEQPIAKGQWDEMAELCKTTPLPIALDEELIGVFHKEDKIKLLQKIQPQYIILKPSFIGGFKGSEEWIKIANQKDIAWWTTSALESNIGLSAIAQWNFTLNNPMPSGLGTGSLYTNNFDCPLFIEKGRIGYDIDRSWEIDL